MGGVTTYYVGDHFEWTGSTSTMVKYYYAGGQRVAMRQGRTLYFLLGAHLGSTSVTAHRNGTLSSSQRYSPWGGTQSGSSPTSFQTSSTDLGTLYYLDPAHAHAATHVGGKLATHRKYTYDANGSMLTRVENGATYTQGWNQENRLQTVTVNGTTTTFTYDGDGVLVKKVIGNATTYYVGPHFEKTSAPEVVTKYYTFGGQRVAMRVCNWSGGSCGTNGVNSTLTYLHSDHLGSASVATCGNTGGCSGVALGGVVSSMRYTAYGLARPGGTMVTDRRFTGQRYEAGLGLYDYNARFYDPYLNRFLAADTLVPDPTNPQSLNRYSYAYNHLLRHVDPTRHAPLDEPWQAEFEKAHGGVPDWHDRLIRLFSIAYPVELIGL